MTDFVSIIFVSRHTVLPIKIDFYHKVAVDCRQSCIENALAVSEFTNPKSGTDGSKRRFTPLWQQPQRGQAAQQDRLANEDFLKRGRPTGRPRTYQTTQFRIKPL